MSEHVATVEVSQCRSCGAAIWWGETQNGKRCPYDIVNDEPTRQSHFGTCPDAKRWTKKGAKA